jgi:hypothetical protein
MPVAQAPQVRARPPEWGGPPENSGKAMASLICGLVFFFWPLSAVAAVILGHLALSDIKRSAGRLAGRGMAIGRIGDRLYRCFDYSYLDHSGDCDSESVAIENGGE